ncbi:MAG: TonB-dependent receptor [Chitinophagaceae bacterium]
MKKQLFLLLIFISFYSFIKSQQAQILKSSLTGKVTDAKTGEPLAGASVYFPDLRTGAATNSQGIYTITNISRGRYSVEVSHLGYATIIEVIEINGNTTHDFALVTSFIENEAVTVTGVSAATSTRRTAIPVNIVRKEELFRNASVNLIENLTKTPGVSQVSTGPAISKPNIRGLGYNRVVVVNDGLRQEGQQWGDEHGIEIDELNVGKVEILKGPASLMYGSDALAGVINIISVQPVSEAKTVGNIFGSYQTNNRQRSFHADFGGNHKGIIWGWFGSYKAAGDYKNKFDGYVFNSKFNEKNFGGYTGINRGWGYSHLSFSLFNQQVGLVEGERDNATGKFLKWINNNGTPEEAIATAKDFKSTLPFIPRQQIQHVKLVSDNSIKLSKGRLTAVGGYQSNQRKEFGNILNPSEKELHFDLETINYNFQYHFEEKNSWRSTLGINGMSQWNKNKGVNSLIPDYNLFDAGIFIFSQKRSNHTTLSGGVRFDERNLHAKQLVQNGSVKFEAFQRNFSNISASAGISYEASRLLTLKFNLARGFRAPVLAELSSNGAHEGTNRFEYGRKDLKSETSFQGDAGIELNSEHLSLTANIFHNAIQNFIFYRKLSAMNGGDSIIVDGSDEFFAFTFDQQNARLFGGELYVDIHPHPLDWLHIENTFSFVRGQLGKKQDGSRNLPFIPAPRLLNEIKAEFLKKGKLFKNAFLRIELDNNFSQNKPFTGYNTETATEGYSLLNIGLGGDVMNAGKKLLTLFLAVNNITDVAYQNHLSRLKYAPENFATGRKGIFNMGRNFAIKLNLPLDFRHKEK